MSLLALTQRIADAKVQCFDGVPCSTGLPTVQASEGNLAIIMQLVFGIIGGVAVIVIIVAAMSMISAQGDPQKVAQARQTVIFAAVGLAIAISAETIVYFVIGHL
jgi:type IV secretion system pilin